MRPDLILFGAFERHNFGDLLMGYVFEKALAKKGIHAIHASILNNDLTAYSGRVVHSIFDLVDSGLDERTPILHVGGETLPCSFTSALNIDSPLALPHRQQTMVSEEVHHRLRSNRKFPYITPPRETINDRQIEWANRLFYGIGFTHLGPNTGINSDLRDALEEAWMSGFRDRTSLENATSIGISNIVFTPDVVCYISKLMPRVEVKAQNYALLHFNKKFLGEHRNTLIDQLATMSRASGFSIKVGVAGIANHHDSLDDLYAFKALASQKSLSVEILTSLDALDICQQIANASLVISTSLHYRIVARSYGVPRISLNAHKVNCWAHANDRLHPFGSEVATLASTADHYLSNLKSTDSSGQEEDLDILESHLERITEFVRSEQSVSAEQAWITKPPHRLPQAPGQDLWIASMASCLDHQQAKLKQQNDTIRRQEICLASKRYLLKRLLILTLPAALLSYLFKSPMQDGCTS